VFILVDLALGVLILFACGLVAFRFIQPPPKVQALAKNELGPDAAGASKFNIPDPYREYPGIVGSGLFGDAGRFNPDAAPPPPPPPPEDPVEETQLNLLLLGTTALWDFGSAIIENQGAPRDQTRKTKSYVVGDEIMASVKLEEVFPRHVIIMNQGKRERLSMDDEEMKEQIAARPDPNPQPVADNSGNDRVTLDRQAFIQELYTNYADLVTKVKPEMARDANGNVIGVTAANISQVPLAGKLGLEDGDVLQTVNNERIDSEQKIMEMVQKYQNASSFRIGLQRNGKTVVKTYRFK
jgi:general secretion pathway protein C